MSSSAGQEGLSSDSVELSAWKDHQPYPSNIPTSQLSEYVPGDAEMTDVSPDASDVEAGNGDGHSREGRPSGRITVTENKKGVGLRGDVMSERVITRKSVAEDAQQRPGAVSACRDILRNLRERGNSLLPANSWCELCTLKPSKQGGYIQLSWRGENKFATLQEVLIWSKGQVRPATFDVKEGETIITTAGGQEFDVSHLCHNTRCMVADHVVAEPRQQNNGRKGCLPWISCSPACSLCSGNRVVFLCTHDPPCIRWHPAYSGQRELLENGICRDESQALRREGERRAALAVLSEETLASEQETAREDATEESD